MLGSESHTKALVETNRGGNGACRVLAASRKHEKDRGGSPDAGLPESAVTKAFSVLREDRGGTAARLCFTE